MNRWYRLIELQQVVVDSHRTSLASAQRSLQNLNHLPSHEVESLERTGIGDLEEHRRSAEARLEQSRMMALDAERRLKQLRKLAENKEMSERRAANRVELRNLEEFVERKR